MSVSVICPNGHRLKAKDALAGQTLKCPGCQASFVVPIPPELVEDHGLEIFDDTFGELDAPGEPAWQGPLGELPRRFPTQLGSEPPRSPNAQTRQGTSFIGTSTVLWGAAGSGLLVGLLLVALVGWLLFGGGSRETGGEKPSLARLKPESVPIQPATPHPTEPERQTAHELGQALPVYPPGPTFRPLEAAAKPYDLVKPDGNIDPRIEVFVLPGPTWAAAYDPVSGRLAITHDDAGILVYDIDELAAGNPSPVAAIGTKGLPTAVCCKPLQDRRVLAVAGQDEPEVHLYDVETFERIGQVSVGAKHVGYLHGSSNPHDPFVYYATSSAGDRHGSFTQNRLGRFDAVSMKSLEQITGRGSSAAVSDLVTSSDGEILYHRRSIEDAGAATWKADGREPSLQQLGAPRNCYGMWPEPHGQSVAVGRILMSRNLWRYGPRAPFEVKGFFRERPVIIGIGDQQTLGFASANTYKQLASVSLPSAWFARSPTPDFRIRPELSSALKTNFLDVYADDRRHCGLFVFHEQLVIAPLSRLQLPAEKSLVVKNHPPTTVYIDQEVTVDLQTEAADVEFQVVTWDEDDPAKVNGSVKPLGARSLSAFVARPLLRLAAPVDQQQTSISVRDVTPIETLTLPHDILIGQERMTVRGVDALNASLSVTRKDALPHAVTEPVMQFGPTSTCASNLPTIQGRTFRWRPSADQLGRQTIRMRARSGEVTREWYWDVTVAKQTKIPVATLQLQREN